MSDALIRSAFESRLAAWAAAQTPAIPIAYQNKPFDPPVGVYLRSFILPAGTISLTLDRKHRQYKGVFQVSIVAPLATGPGAAEAVATALDALFPIDAPLAVGSILVWLLSPMSAAPAQQEPARYVIPVSAQYQSDTA